MHPRVRFLLAERAAKISSTVERLFVPACDTYVITHGSVSSTSLTAPLVCFPYPGLRRSLLCLWRHIRLPIAEQRRHPKVPAQNRPVVARALGRCLRQHLRAVLPRRASSIAQTPLSIPLHITPLNELYLSIVHRLSIQLVALCSSRPRQLPHLSTGCSSTRLSPISPNLSF